jgi:hypothetical protein
VAQLAGLSGYPHPLPALRPEPSRFPAGSWGPHCATVPRAIVKSRGSSSRGLHSPLACHRATPAKAPQDLSTSHGVALPIAASENRVHSREKLPRLPLRSALRVSHPLDGLRPSLPCGLVSCRSHVRDSPYRGFPSRAAVPAFRQAEPSCRCRASPTNLAARASSARPDFRASRHPGIRCVQRKCYPTPAPDPLLGFSSLGFSLSPRRKRLPASSSHELRPGPFTLIPVPALRSVARSEPGWSLSRLPTRTRFLHHAAPTNSKERRPGLCVHLSARPPLPRDAVTSLGRPPSCRSPAGLHCGARSEQPTQAAQLRLREGIAGAMPTPPARAAIAQVPVSALHARNNSQHLHHMWRSVIVRTLDSAAHRVVLRA